MDCDPFKCAMHFQLEHKKRESERSEIKIIFKKKVFAVLIHKFIAFFRKKTSVSVN